MSNAWIPSYVCLYMCFSYYLTSCSHSENNYSKLCDRGLFMFSILYIQVVLEFYKYFKQVYSLKCIKINQILIKLLIAEIYHLIFLLLYLIFCNFCLRSLLIYWAFCHRDNIESVNELLYSVSNSKIWPFYKLNYRDLNI